MRNVFRCTAAFLSAVVSLDVLAADFNKKIPSGSSYAEVLSLWGDPVDKVEEGLLKKTIWYYKDGAKVVFKNGRVRSFRPTNAVIAQQVIQEESKAAAQVSASTISGETRDLVRDIAKEVPSGPDVPFSESAGSVPAGIPNVPAQVGRGAAPPAIAPADELLEED
ncbi:MAG: hypothetical protein ACK5HO_12495 [Pseudomonadota bacterium]|jgi:hypothetical protein